MKDYASSLFQENRTCPLGFDKLAGLLKKIVFEDKDMFLLIKIHNKM